VRIGKNLWVGFLDHGFGSSLKFKSPYRIFIKSSILLCKQPFSSDEKYLKSLNWKVVRIMVSGPSPDAKARTLFEPNPWSKTA
jgi:hypothetical protein